MSYLQYYLENYMSEFEELSKPLIKYLNDNYHPHASIIIDCMHAEVLEGLEAFITEEFLRD